MIGNIFGQKHEREQRTLIKTSSEMIESSGIVCGLGCRSSIILKIVKMPPEKDILFSAYAKVPGKHRTSTVKNGNHLS